MVEQEHRVVLIERHHWIKNNVIFGRSGNAEIDPFAALTGRGELRWQTGVFDDVSLSIYLRLSRGVIVVPKLHQT